MNHEEFKAKAFAKDPELYKEYMALEPRYNLITEIIRLRAENNLTQTQLAARIGTTQRIISNFENGNYNPSVDFLNKLATGLGKKLEIQLK